MTLTWGLTHCRRRQHDWQRQSWLWRDPLQAQFGERLRDDGLLGRGLTASRLRWDCQEGTKRRLRALFSSNLDSSANLDAPAVSALGSLSDWQVRTRLRYVGFFRGPATTARAVEAPWLRQHRFLNALGESRREACWPDWLAGHGRLRLDGPDAGGGGLRAF
jgi:hypothetical protein